MSAARTLPFRGTRFGSPGAGSLSLGIPAAAYPGRVATTSDLIVAVDQQQTTLLLPMGVSDLTITVLDPSSIKAFNLLSIDSEIVKTLGAPAGNIIPVSRGFDGTIPAAHLANAVVAGFIDAYHHNALVAEIEAIEATLGANMANVANAGLPFLVSSNYVFAPQSPGGSLTVGTSVITLNPVPKGVNGTDANHWLYISGGTGTAEPVLITGGTAVAGNPSGTLIVTCANTHSGAWTIQTATAGVQEAIVAAGKPSCIVMPAGALSMHGPVYVPIGGYVIQGQGQTATTISIDQTYPIANAAITGAPFVLQPGVNQAEFGEFQVNYFQPDSTVYAAYIHYQPTFYSQNSSYVRLYHVNTNFAWVSGDFRANGSGMTWADSYISGFDTAIKMAGNGDTYRLRGVVTTTGYGGTANQATVYSSNATGFSAVGAFLDVDSCLSLASIGWVIDGNGGGEFQNFVNCAFDTSNGLSITNFAEVHIANSYFTPGLNSTFWFNATSSDVFVDNCYFSPNFSLGSSAVPLVTAVSGSVAIRDSMFNLSSADVPLVTHSGTGSFNFSDNVLASADASFTRVRITIAALISAIVTGNTLGAMFGSHTGTFLSFTGGNSGPALVTGNNLIGNNGSSPWLIAGVSNLISGVVKDNPGYNPVGLSAIAVGASPFTYAAGPGPETIYITGGTVSLIKRGATTVATASPAQITLPPFGTVQVTYSAAPAMVKDVL